MQHNVSPARLSVLVLFALALLLPAIVRPTMAAQLYSNNTPIVFTDDNSAGPALAPNYPSTIAVAGLKGSIIGMTVTLTGVTHNFPDNLDLLLVGPDGKQVMLMSDAGGATELRNVNLTFADGQSALPGSSAIASGTYRPSNYAPADSFPAPAPAPVGGANYPTSLAAFNLSNPNGEWRLFAMEDESTSSGSIAGWSLSLQTADLVASVPADPAAAGVSAGSPLTYAVAVANEGTEPVASPIVTIGIPEGTVYSGVLAPSGWNCTPPAPGAASFTCATASFAITSVGFTVTVVVDKALAPDTVFTRSVQIGSAVAEADTANNSATASTTVRTVADLAVTSVDAPASINAGEVLNTLVTVFNNGPSNAANARVTIPVPANTSFVSIVAPEGWNCTMPEIGATGEAVCNAAVFTTASASFTLQVKVDPALPPGSSIESRANVNSGTPDSAPGNNGAGYTTAVATLTDLTVAVIDTPRPVAANSRLTYSFDVTNNGPSNAATTRLATAVVRGTTFVSIVAPAGWSCTTPPVGGIGAVTCDHASFGVQTESIVMTVQVISGMPEGAVIRTNSALTTGTSDSNIGNNGAITETPVTVAADLAVRIEGVGAIVQPHSTISYVLKVNNSGPEPAEGVTLTSAVPAATKLVSFVAPAGWSCQTPNLGGSGAINCTHEGMDVTTDSFVLTVQLEKMQNRAELSMGATIAAATDKNSANNSVTLNSVVTFRIDLPLVRR